MIILIEEYKGVTMLKNFFKITFRNIIRNKTYSFINITGLSVGIACFIIIFLFINTELSNDNFHKDGERIYRVLRTSSNVDENYKIGVTSAPFSKDFLKLIIIANLAAIPLIYYLMNKWLQDFAYRIEIDSGTIIISAFSVLIISIFTIGVQAFKAATSNPVKSLRYE